MKLRTLGVVSSLALAVSMAAPAYAQDNGSNSANSAATDDSASANTADANQIVVTAEFRKENLQDTPIAITAVNSAMLEARGQTDITQVAAQAPNVTLRPQPQNGGSGLIAFIRGVGQTDFDYALDPGVGVYIDDVYIPTLSSSLLELLDLDRVEILRGPQGTLAGKNAIGGAIKLFTAEPKGDGSGSVSVEYGSYNDIAVRGMADFKITDNLAMRVSGLGRGHDGYVAMLDYGQTHPNSNVPENNTRGPDSPDYSSMGGENVIAGRAALRWTPGDRLVVNLSGDYTRERDEAIPVVVIAAGAPANSNFDPTSEGLATNGGRTLLVGKDQNPVPIDCHFVPAGPYSCDTGANLGGHDPRFVSYSNFLDASQTSLADPFKPYFALPISNFQGWGVQGNATFNLTDDVNLEYIGSYRAYESEFGQDQDGTPVPAAQLDNRLNHHAFSSELRLNFKAGNGLLEGTVGGYYLDQEGTYRARVDLNYAFAPLSLDFLHGPDTTPSKTKALFGTITLHPTDGLSLTGGLRYTDDRKDYTYFRRNPDGTIPDGATCNPFAAPNCALAGLYDITGTYKGSRVDYRGVVNYRFSEQFMAYASISTGFKGGGVNPRPFFPDQKLPFDPETLTTYEVGFKADLLDRRVRLDGAAFINKYDDIVLTKILCPETLEISPCLRPANIGSANVKGLELEASIFPTDGLSLNGSISYLDFKYTSPTEHADPADPNSPLVLVGTDIPVGGITPYTPTLTYSIGAQYDYETKAGTFSVRFDGNYQSKLYTTAENTVWSEVPGYFLGNGHISWASKDDNWKVTLEVKNIFDKYYWLSVSDVTTGGFFGEETGVPGMPRTWSVKVERKF